MTCKHCGTDIADKALICYKCGNATAEPRIKPPQDGPILVDRSRSRMPLVVLVVVLAAALFAAWAAGWLG